MPGDHSNITIVNANKNLRNTKKTLNRRAGLELHFMFS